MSLRGERPQRYSVLAAQDQGRRGRLRRRLGVGVRETGCRRSIALPRHGCAAAPRAYLTKTRGNSTGTAPVGTPERVNQSRWGCQTPIERRRHRSTRTLHVFLSRLSIPRYPHALHVLSAPSGLFIPRYPHASHVLSARRVSSALHVLSASLSPRIACPVSSQPSPDGSTLTTRCMSSQPCPLSRFCMSCQLDELDGVVRPRSSVGDIDLHACCTSIYPVFLSLVIPTHRMSCQLVVSAPHCMSCQLASELASGFPSSKTVTALLHHTMLDRTDRTSDFSVQTPSSRRPKR
jgi:hypothetical protein